MQAAAANCFSETPVVTIATDGAWESVIADFKRQSSGILTPFSESAGLCDSLCFSVIWSMASWDTKEANCGDSDRKTTLGERCCLA